MQLQPSASYRGEAHIPEIPNHSRDSLSHEHVLLGHLPITPTDVRPGGDCVGNTGQNNLVGIFGG